MYHVYVLRSLKNNKHYTGFTRQSLEEKLVEHNSGATKWSSSARPFELVYYETLENEGLARRRERFLKSGHGREFLNRGPSRSFSPPQGMAEKNS